MEIQPENAILSIVYCTLAKQADEGKASHDGNFQLEREREECFTFRLNYTEWEKEEIACSFLIVWQIEQ